MSETKCRHGISQEQTCRRCGRIKKVRAPAWEAREQSFNESIRKLEAAVKPLLEEVARTQTESNAIWQGLPSERKPSEDKPSDDKPSEDKPEDPGPKVAPGTQGPPVRSYPARPGWTL